MERENLRRDIDRADVETGQADDVGNAAQGKPLSKNRR